jgi:hypothetical protein
MFAPKDQHARVEVITIELLNRSESCNTRKQYEIHHSMEAAARRFLSSLTPSGEIAADEVAKETGNPYYSSTHYRHSHHNFAAG